MDATPPAMGRRQSSLMGGLCAFAPSRAGEDEDSDASSGSSREGSEGALSRYQSVHSGESSHGDHKASQDCLLCRIFSYKGACAMIAGEPLEKELRDRNIVSGSKVLLTVTAAMFLLKLAVSLVIWVSKHHIDNFIIAYGRIRLATHVIVQCFTLAMVGLCLRRPRLAIYFPTVVFWIFYHMVFWLFFPLKELQDFAGEIVSFYAKDQDGYVAISGNMWLVFLLPLLIPERRLMACVSRAWILIFFLISSVCIGMETHEGTAPSRETRYRFNFDLTVGVLFLGAGFVIVNGRKRSLEEEQLTIFRLDQRKKGVSKHMFNVLGCMVPNFLLVPLLKDPERSKPIAYNVERVSILFIMLEGFNQMVTGSMSPHQLLIVLNRHFTQIDDICEQNGVTKIETVGHEYVCAVGVSPEDRAKDERLGHQGILCGLVRVAQQLLELQNQQQHEPVVFQMGIHTGAVVAGVIGKRLPRFRLFGDAVNTAARMMQRGLPGEVQFSQATRDELPSWARFEERGQVEMKGKGPMTTYLLRGGQGHGARASSSSSPAAAPGTRGSAGSPQRGGSPPRNPELQRRPQMRRGLTVMLLECSNEQLPEPQVDTPHEHLSFEEYLEDLSVGNALEKPKMARRFSASEAFWSSRYKMSSEEVFREWFHQNFFCLNLDRRLRRLMKAFFGLFLIEALYLFCNCEDSRRGLWIVLSDFPMFIGFRVASMAIVAAWLLIVACCEWTRTHPKLTQRTMLASWCVLLSLVFVSYASLPFMFNALENSTDSHSHFPLKGISRNVVYLDCFPLCMVVMMGLPFTFVQACAFPPLMGVLVFCVDPFLPAYLPNHVLKNILVDCIFFVGALVCTVLAYLQEANLRDRHHAQCAVNHALSKVEGILNNLMPPKVLESLQVAEARPQHHYSEATVVQSDLVGFTQLASSRDPTEVVEIISNLFGIYDRLADKRGIYKVETVGDAYIAAQAEEPLSSTNSPVCVVLFGLDMVDATHQWAKAHGEEVSCRVGVHAGECVGGVVGNDMQRYHLFGQLMTVLDVMESTAPRGKVHVSLACRRAVEKERLGREGAVDPSEDVLLEPRPEGPLSTSKGEMHSLSEVGGATSIASRAGTSRDER